LVSGVSNWGIMIKLRIFPVVFALMFAINYCAARPYRPVEPLPSGIIDMHVHVAGIGAGGSGCFISPKIRKNWRFKIDLKSFGVTEKELEEKGDMLVADRLSEKLAQSRYVSKAVVLALDGIVDKNGDLDMQRTEIYVPNEFVVAAVAKHNNLMFGASINPYRKDAIERLEWAKAHGAVLVKWIPSVMNIDPGDGRIIPFYKKLVELNLPLLSHAGKERSFPVTDDSLCDPEKLKLPLSLGVKVIAAHIASTGRYHGERSSVRLERMMRQYPNLYSDISSLTQINKLRYLKEALTKPEFEGRLVYGSDYPLINTIMVSSWYYANRLGPKKAKDIEKLKNPWDIDVKIKQELGTPADIFTRFEKLFLPQSPAGMAVSSAPVAISTYAPAALPAVQTK